MCPALSLCVPCPLSVCARSSTLFPPLLPHSQDLAAQQREVELELCNRRLEESTRQREELQGTVDRLEADKCRTAEEVTALHGLVDNLRGELRDKEREAEQLRHVAGQLQQAQTQLQQARAQADKDQGDLKRLAFLEVPTSSHSHTHITMPHMAPFIDNYSPYLL